MWFKRQRETALASCNYWTWNAARTLADCLWACEMHPESSNDQTTGTWGLCHQRDTPSTQPHQDSRPALITWRRINHKPQSPQHRWFQTPATKHWPEPDLLCTGIFLPKAEETCSCTNCSSTSAPSKYFISSQRTSRIHFTVPRM